MTEIIIAEAFFLADGTLVVGSACKKEFFATKCEEFPLNDGEWHSIVVCQVRKRTYFSYKISRFVIENTLEMFFYIR